MFDAHFLSRRNLHAVDVASIPDRFKDAVAETKHHDVLHCLFAEVMIDAINLVFVQDLLDFLIELLRGLQIAPERLFDHDPSPLLVIFANQTDRAQLFDYGRKIVGRRSKIEKIVAFGASLFIDLA